MKINDVNSDAWTSGQIESKLWLCRELEKIKTSTPQRIWILAGWYGILGFLLLSREQLDIQHIRSFDIDEDACQKADLFNENYIFQKWKFKAFCTDINKLSYSNHSEYGQTPHIIINTSCEHMSQNTWWENIPKNTTIALQSNNMPHEDHINSVSSLDEFKQKYPLTKIFFKGALNFIYPDSQFTRFMLIGKN